MDTPFKIEIYESDDGKCPYDDWLESLDPKTAARIEVRIRRFKSGNFGDHKLLGEGVFEARLFFGPGYRVYFGKEKGRLILLLAGGDKASQNKDIKKAKDLLKEWRKNDG